MKNFFKTLALVAFSLLLCVVTGEIGIRIAAPQRLDSVRPIFDPDDDVVFKLKKNLSITYSQFEFSVPEHTNSMGFRDKELGPKQPGTYRIMGLGDSFSYANGTTLEETYFKQTEKCLSGSGRPVEFVNCAVPAYSVIQEVNFLKKFGPAVQPDAVVIGFYVGNDFIDSYALYDEHGKALIFVKDGNLASTKLSDQVGGIRGLLQPVRDYCATHSHLYVFLRNRMSELLSKVGLRTPPPPPDFCKKDFSEDMKKGWELDQRLLLEAEEYTKARGMKLIVVVLPAIYQVYEAAWTQYFTNFHVDPNLYDLDKPQAIVDSFCAEHGIECLDVISKMRREGQSKMLYYKVDSHMNPEGHRVVADTLCAYLSHDLRNAATQ